MFNLNKKLVGRFEKLIDARNKLGIYVHNRDLEEGVYANSHIAIYEDNYNEEALNKIINNLDFFESGRIAKHRDLSGSNNPMYKKGIHFYVYDVNKNLVNEYFTCSDCIKELKQTRETIRINLDTNKPSKTGYYFKTIRFDKDEPSYN